MADKSWSPDKSPRVIIIGGGLAGLGAAHCLLQRGVHPDSVQILEAKSHIGGRVFCITPDIAKPGDRSIDVGAQFLHGIEGNPIYELSIEKGVLLPNDATSPDLQDDVQESFFCLSNGHKIKTKITKKIWKVVNDIFKEACKFGYGDVSFEDPQDSLGSYVEREFQKYLQEDCSKDSNEKYHQKCLLFDWLMMRERVESGCENVLGLSLQSWGHYVEYDGDQGFDYSGRYQLLLNAIIGDIPEHCITLQSTVKCITWDQDDSIAGAVTVLTENDDIFHADHVIVTCSLGYLKQHLHSLFSPALPMDKVAVIENMGFGTVNKIFLEYDHPFWDKDQAGYQFIWDKDVPVELTCVENSHREQYLYKDWYRRIQGFDTLITHPTLLEGWITGEDAVIMETIPENVVMDICHELLQKFTGISTIAKPSKIIRSRWNCDAYTRGSYSYVKVGRKTDDCDVLAKPLKDTNNVPRVLFAGEATDSQHIGTTQGAWLSGHREADRILEYMKSAY